MDETLPEFLLLIACSPHPGCITADSVGSDWYRFDFDRHEPVPHSGDTRVVTEELLMSTTATHSSLCWCHGDELVAIPTFFCL